jgi:hypothetical protein
VDCLSYGQEAFPELISFFAAGVFPTQAEIDFFTALIFFKIQREGSFGVERGVQQLFDFLCW